MNQIKLQEEETKIEPLFIEKDMVIDPFNMKLTKVSTIYNTIDTVLENTKQSTIDDFTCLYALRNSLLNTFTNRLEYLISTSFNLFECRMHNLINEQLLICREVSSKPFSSPVYYDNISVISIINYLENQYPFITDPRYLVGISDNDKDIIINSIIMDISSNILNKITIDSTVDPDIDKKLNFVEINNRVQFFLLELSSNIYRNLQTLIEESKLYFESGLPGIEEVIVNKTIEEPMSEIVEEIVK